VVARRLTRPTITRSDSPPVRALGRVAGGRRPEQPRPMVGPPNVPAPTGTECSEF
jgi:hypothetical protein